MYILFFSVTIDRLTREFNTRCAAN